MATRTITQAQFDGLLLESARLLPPRGQTSANPTSVSWRNVTADLYTFSLRDERKRVYGSMTATRLGPDAWELSSDDDSILSRAVE